MPRAWPRDPSPLKWLAVTPSKSEDQNGCEAAHTLGQPSLPATFSSVKPHSTATMHAYAGVNRGAKQRQFVSLDVSLKKQKAQPDAG